MSISRAFPRAVMLSVSLFGGFVKVASHYTLALRSIIRPVLSVRACKLRLLLDVSRFLGKFLGCYSRRGGEGPLAKIGCTFSDDWQSAGTGSVASVHGDIHLVYVTMSLLLLVL